MKNEEKKCHFERNNYYYGKFLTLEDMSLEQRYFDEKRWLMTRLVNGWGVVCGLNVEKKQGESCKVTVTPGLAIDAKGREILVSKAQEISLVQEWEARVEQKEGEKQESKKVAICIEFDEIKTEVINIPPVDDEEERLEYNRVRDYFNILVIPESKVDEEESYLVLAEFTIKPLKDSSGTWDIDKIDTYSKRNRVYSNPELFDLVEGPQRYLPHIKELNWTHASTYTENDKENPLEGGLVVDFDRKMNGDTITGKTFSVLVKVKNDKTDTYRYEYVPGKVSYDEGDENEGPFQAAFKVEPGWNAEFVQVVSNSSEETHEFMVVLKGDHIMSVERNGEPSKALDGNFIGGNKPSGNGIQGGDFVSWFKISPLEQVQENEIVPQPNQESV